MVVPAGGERPGRIPVNRRLTLVAAALLLPFGWLLVMVHGGGRVVRLDASVADHLHAWAVGSDGWVAALRAVTDLGAGLWLAALTAPVVLWLLVRRRPRSAFFLAATALGGALLVRVVKEAVGRARPSFPDPVATATGRSFPSGHAMNSIVVYGALLLVLLPAVRPAWRVPAIAATGLLVAAIGFTRLALGVHYLSDVLGGWVLGLAWLAACTAASGAWRRPASSAQSDGALSAVGPP
ncbi:MAG TPA: phosphatase PAP2 family protein [Acidimicrobiales bacterium]|nr:phosphatase PAP2 family protein [Acidimicrobiales bacterium]